MPLINNKVGDDGTTSSKNLEKGKALIDSLIKVVACYHQLASCVGGCTDNLHLHAELRPMRERALKLAVASHHHLAARLRDNALPQEERQERRWLWDMELLWVAFTSSLELLHADMCKVFTMGSNFSLVNNNALVKTGIQRREVSLSEGQFLYCFPHRAGSRQSDISSRLGPLAASEASTFES
ncbi:regulator of G-protein signaling 9-binding protein [Salmo salar]|uniref:Regulator of G-protein signaling 9-binding protein n=1 Tax=Salmo salar TaxID=8030 RepID=A0ABM3DGG7_SALSA|nr:regulator of G-protein signaling 9-binding protein [Salmo salar]